MGTPVREKCAVCGSAIPKEDTVYVSDSGDDPRYIRTVCAKCVNEAVIPVDEQVQSETESESEIVPAEDRKVLEPLETEPDAKESQTDTCSFCGKDFPVAELVKDDAGCVYCKPDADLLKQALDYLERNPVKWLGTCKCMKCARKISSERTWFVSPSDGVWETYCNDCFPAIKEKVDDLYRRYCLMAPFGHVPEGYVNSLPKTEQQADEKAGVQSESTDLHTSTIRADYRYDLMLPRIASYLFPNSISQQELAKALLNKRIEPITVTHKLAEVLQINMKKDSFATIAHLYAQALHERANKQSQEVSESDLINSALYHLSKYAAGDKTENHAGQLVWNVLTLSNYYLTQEGRNDR